MKFKKLSMMGILFSSILSITSCNPTSSSSSESSDESSSSIVDKSLFTDEGYRKLSSEPSEAEIDEFILDIVSKGSEAITGGITAYGKTLVINILKECGIDLRDATAKTLEKIQQQLSAIENKLKAIAEKMERDHSETILSPVLKQVQETQVNYGKFSVSGIQVLLNLEKDETMTEEEIERERYRFYDEQVQYLTINNLPLATYVSNLASYILQPNKASGKSIFYYYFQTIASYDVWSIQRLKNVRSFIAYIDSVLFLTANLAKFQMYYLAQGKGEASLAVYNDMMDTMAKNVNAVNELFKKQLESMKEYEDKMNNNINVFLPNNKEYSTRLATLTYNKDDIGDQSRQALLYGYDDSHGKHQFGQYAYTYTPDKTLIDGVAKSFQDYYSEYCTTDYTIQDWLTFCGFSANNKELYENAAGIFQGDMNVINCGYLNDDHDYYIGYYDKQGKYSRKKIYQVDTYHKRAFEIDYANLNFCDDQYYLCFMYEDNGVQYLEGYYNEIFMKDWCYKVIDEGIQYKFDYYKLINQNSQLPFRQVKDNW